MTIGFCFFCQANREARRINAKLELKKCGMYKLSKISKYDG